MVDIELNYYYFVCFVCSSWKNDCWCGYQFDILKIGLLNEIVVFQVIGGSSVVRCQFGMNIWLRMFEQFIVGVGGQQVGNFGIGLGGLQGIFGGIGYCQKCQCYVIMCFCLGLVVSGIIGFIQVVEYQVIMVIKFVLICLECYYCFVCCFVGSCNIFVFVQDLYVKILYVCCDWLVLWGDLWLFGECVKGCVCV